MRSCRLNFKGRVNMAYKKYFLLFILILAAIFSAPDVSLAEYFVINQYDVNAIVLESNRYQMLETLEVEFTAPRHGIIRAIPERYNNRPVLIENVYVEGYDYNVYRESGQLNIQIGSPDYTVAGRQIYKIHYDYDMGEDGIQEYDEFYFNLIGTEWNTQIHNASFTVQMPKEFDSSRVNFTRGTYGSTRTDGLAYEVNGNIITGRITAALNNNEGVTIALPLPEGYYTGEREVQDMMRNMARWNWLLFPLLMAVALFIWYRFGRDKPLYPSVQFYPPQGISSCDIGYIMDGKVDGKDVTSLLFYWADKGHLVIQEEEKTWFLGKEIFRFIRKKELDDTAQEYERIAFDDLFSFGDGYQVTTEDLKENFYKTISTVSSMVEGRFSGVTAIWSKTSKIMSLLALLLSSLPYVYLVQQVIAYYGGVANGWILLITVGIIVMIINGGLVALTSRWEGYNLRQKRGRIIIALLIFIIMLGLPAYIIFSIGIPVLEAVKASLTGTFIAAIAGLVTQKSEYGHRMYEYLLGFREFLNQAEKEKIEELVEQNPSYFYNILPYAVVLGVTEKWADKFKTIVTQPPDWYYGPAHYGAFNTVNFSQAMDNCFTQANRSMTSAPSSKGSSIGGGFSGGGGGGGGGSSW